MIVRIDPSRPPSLEEADNFRAFKVACASPREACAAGFAEVGRLEGDHLWVDAEWLKAHGPDDDAWRGGLDKMVDYATSAGWVDDAGAVRAHIEDV